MVNPNLKRVFAMEGPSPHVAKIIDSANAIYETETFHVRQTKGNYDRFQSRFAISALFHQLSFVQL
jgi:hypothetical protein